MIFGEPKEAWLSPQDLATTMPRSSHSGCMFGILMWPLQRTLLGASSGPTNAESLLNQCPQKGSSLAIHPEVQRITFFEWINLSWATKPSQIKPNWAKPSQAKQSQAKPSQAKANKIKPNWTNPNQTKSNQTNPNQIKAIQTKPNQSKPKQAKPSQTKPIWNKPSQTKLNQSSSEDPTPSSPADSLLRSVRFLLQAFPACPNLDESLRLWEKQYHSTEKPGVDKENAKVGLFPSN